MPLWGFNRESTQTVAGANTVAGIKAGFQAPFVSGTNPAGGGEELKEKRNIIATSKGWVRRIHKTDTHSQVRVIEDVIVAANPGGGLQYTSNTHLGKADIVQMYVKLNANGYIGANVSSANLYVVFNTPITFKASGNLMSILVANTSGGNHAVALFANTVAQLRVIHANNTLVFRLPPLRGRGSSPTAGSLAATYRVNAQAITVTGMPLYNPDEGTNSSANVIITGAVSNNLMNGIGTRVTTFLVARPAGQV